MKGILIEYEYAGDPNPWQQAVTQFIESINSDPALRGKFTYLVTEFDGGKKIHIGRWMDEETLEHLQSQEFFRQFAGKIKNFAGDSLRTTPHTPFRESAPLMLN